MTPISGSCAACGTKATSRLRWKGRRVLGCNRCASRVRQGGSFEGPYVSRREHTKVLSTLAARMRKQGKTQVEIARKIGLSTTSVRRMLGGV